MKAEAAWEKLNEVDIEDIRVLAYTQPKLVKGIPKKKPELMELRIGGGNMDARLEYAKSILGKEISITDFTKDGAMIDVAAITKGKGFQGAIKRWGLKLLCHKNSKHRRMIGTLAPKRPGYVRPTVPQAGQVGYHQRTEMNKRIIKIGQTGEEVNPKGGFLHYGQVVNSYVLIHGSVPGPTKRLVRLRDPVRKTASAQGGAQASSTSPPRASRGRNPWPSKNVNVYSLSGEVVKKAELPSAFKTSYRPDVIRKAVVAEESNKRQPYGSEARGGHEARRVHLGQGTRRGPCAAPVPGSEGRGVAQQRGR